MYNGTRFAILLLVLCYCWMFKCSTLSWTNTTMEGDINKNIHHHINNHHPSEEKRKRKKEERKEEDIIIIIIMIMKKKKKKNED